MMHLKRSIKLPVTTSIYFTSIASIASSANNAAAATTSSSSSNGAKERFVFEVLDEKRGW